MPAPDFTDKYNTKLSDKDETAFQQWATENNRTGDLSDYDLRGWWKKNGKTDSRGHMTDEFKKPNHPTFSQESKYSGKDGYSGGKWSGSDDKGWSFQASPSNLQFQTPEDLQSYFSRVEPDATLELPKTDAERMQGRYGTEQ